MMCVDKCNDQASRLELQTPSLLLTFSSMFLLLFSENDITGNRPS